MNWPEASCIIALVATIAWFASLICFTLDPNRKDEK